MGWAETIERAKRPRLRRKPRARPFLRPGLQEGRPRAGSPEGLKVPQKQPKRGRLWLNDGSCIRLRPEYANHVWSDDFVPDHTHEGRPFRMLTVVDEYTRKCLAIEVGRTLRAEDVLAVLAELFVKRGAPEHLRSENGSEFTARAVRDGLGRLGVKTLFIEPGSPWEKGYFESFNRRLRDGLLAREIFCTLREAKVLIENGRRECDAFRPHGSLGNRPPAPEALVDWLPPEAFPPRPEEARLHEHFTWTDSWGQVTYSPVCEECRRPPIDAARLTFDGISRGARVRSCFLCLLGVIERDQRGRAVATH